MDSYLYSQQHIPVMLKETEHALNIDENGIYVDATFGTGGHSKEILKKLSSEGRLIVFDKDPASICIAKEIFKTDKRVLIFHSSFSKLKENLIKNNFCQLIDGIIFDLGISLFQLNDSRRGFSFMSDGKLDMRMNPGEGISACSWLEKATYDEISNVLNFFGEEKFHKRIAKGIVYNREIKKIETTKQLVGIILKSVLTRDKNKHPATRSFQAIRIFINSELSELSKALDQSKELLKKGGRLVAISFHSIEDRIVKRFLRDECSKGELRLLDFNSLSIFGGSCCVSKKGVKFIKPSDEEIKNNIRARSAIMRIVEKVL